jgi:hypothetical protein
LKGDVALLHNLLGFTFVLPNLHIWNLISRTIAPLIYQPKFFNGQDSKYGLGDIQQSLFLSPGKPGEFIWGAGLEW